MTPDLLTRFGDRILIGDSGQCWEWMGGKHKGYGRIYQARTDGRSYYARAHRVAYELLVGPIPEGTELDHLCRNPGCVNPSHLEPVPHVENVRRGLAGKVNHRNSRKTHCPEGHPYDEKNTAYRSTGKRACLACQRARDRARAGKRRSGRGSR